MAVSRIAKVTLILYGFFLFLHIFGGIYTSIIVNFCTCRDPILLESFNIVSISQSYMAAVEPPLYCPCACLTSQLPLLSDYKVNLYHP